MTRWIALLPLALAACGGAEGGGEAVPAWRLAERPAVRIGVADGPEGEMLHHVVGAVRLADGRIAVANAGSKEVRIFTAEGRFLRAIGREGDGPGEFRGLQAIFRLRGDTLGAWDNLAGRWSYLTADGGFARAVTPDPPIAGLFARAVGAFPDGSFVVRGGWDNRALAAGASGLRRDTVVLVRYAADGRRVGEVARLPGREEFVTTGGGGFTMSLPPFGRDAHAAVGPDAVYVGDGAVYRIDAVSADGRRRAAVADERPPTRVTPEEVSRWRSSRLASISGNPAYLRQERRALDAMPAPGTLPAFRALRADTDGNLWIAEPSAAWSGPTAWRIWSPDGRPIGRVTTEGLHVTDIGRDYVLGTAAGPDGVESVVLLPLSRDPPPGP